MSWTLGADGVVALQAIVVAQIPELSQTVSALGSVPVSMPFGLRVRDAAPPARGFPAMLWLQRNRYL